MPAATETSVQQLTTTEAAVLALLEIEGERSGYDLLKAVSQAIGHIWAPARSGLYAALPRLVTLGLAQSRAVAQSTRPDKHVYRSTRAGRAPNQIGLLPGRSIHFRIFLAHAPEVGLRRLVSHVQLGGDLLGAVARDIQFEGIQFARAQLRTRLGEVAIPGRMSVEGDARVALDPHHLARGVHHLTH